MNCKENCWLVLWFALGIAAIIAIPFMVYDEPAKPCAEWQSTPMLTYPNAGLLALGPQYTAIALMPLWVEVKTCKIFAENAP